MCTSRSKEISASFAISVQMETATPRGFQLLQRIHFYENKQPHKYSLILNYTEMTKSMMSKNTFVL